MADTQEQEEHAEQHPEQLVANAAELNVDTPPEGADVAEINGSEATYGDTVAHPEPVASPAEQDSNIEETPVQTSSPDLEINEHHTAGAAGTGASTEAAAAGKGPPIAAPNMGDETPTSQGEDGNDTGKESEGVALQPATHSEGADEENAADSPAETTVNLQSQMQSPEEKSTAMSSPESPHPSTHPAAGVDEPAGSPYDPVPIVPGPPDIISASPGILAGSRAEVPPTATLPAPGSTRPVRGTLAKPNRGFCGVFVTRNGRKLLPEELVQSVERLSKADLFGVDMNELLAMYANAPKTKPAVGKAYISPEEMESMVERLYTTKPNHGMTYKSRPKPMKAIYYIENGAHLSRLEPIPPKPAQERTDFMCSLYERCKESKLKSQNALAEKYLQPLCKPKLYSGADAKAKIAEIAQKLFAGESTK